jgi:hypothetical protein
VFELDSKARSLSNVLLCHPHAPALPLSTRTTSQAHRLASSLNRLMYSPCYLAFYVLIIFACIGMLAWTLVTK